MRRVMSGWVLILVSALVGCGGASVDYDAWRASFHGTTERDLGGFSDEKVVDANVDLTDSQIDRLVEAFCKDKGANAGVMQWERASGASTMFTRKKLVHVTAAYSASAETAEC